MFKMKVKQIRLNERRLRAIKETDVEVMIIKHNQSEYPRQ